jgi:hypothetical protein
LGKQAINKSTTEEVGRERNNRRKKDGKTNQRR